MKLQTLFSILFLSSSTIACDIICPPEPEDEKNKKVKNDSTTTRATQL